MSEGVHPKEKGNCAGLADEGDVESFVETSDALVAVDGSEGVSGRAVVGDEVVGASFAVVTWMEVDVLWRRVLMTSRGWVRPEQ